MKFLIKFATRGRPEWFKLAIKNIQETISADCEYKILVTIDKDDTTMSNSEMVFYISGTRNLTCYIGDSKNKVEAINANMHLVDEWDILVNMSDDMHFIKNDWDKIIERDYKSVFPEGDAFMHYNDGYAGSALSTMSIMDRIYYERDSYIYHPSYKSFSCDAEAYYVAILRARHHYFDEQLFTHQHPTQTPRLNDATYYANSLHTPHDTKNYFERLNNNFYTGFTGPTIFDQYKTR